jgi:RHS repeat-associated protein
MRQKIRREFSWSGGAWVSTNEIRYVYDRNVVIQERDVSNAPNVSYTRGKDLNGFLEGAGEITGLVARSQPSAPTAQTAFYFCDASGNITTLVSTNQLVVARYLYEPFGNIVSSSGPLADANIYRFSGKEFHKNSGTYYYLYRFYDPNLQRWINRDPVQENGGENLYGFVLNDPISVRDAFGLAPDQKPIRYSADTRCCTGDRIARGEETLKIRYSNAATAAAQLGIKRVSPPNNGGTCKNSSSDILEWLRPTPTCWYCYLEERNKYSPQEERAAKRDLLDHQVVICAAHDKSGATTKEIMFDWWGKAEPGSSPTAFRQKYPYPGGIGESQTSYFSCDGSVGGYTRNPDHGFSSSR